MVNPRLSKEQLEGVEKILHEIDSPEKLRRLEKLLEMEEELDCLVSHHELLVDMAQKEKNWRWLKSATRDSATWFLAVSAAIYGMYEMWIRFLSSSIRKLTGEE